MLNSLIKKQLCVENITKVEYSLSRKSCFWNFQNESAKKTKYTSFTVKIILFYNNNLLQKHKVVYSKHETFVFTNTKNITRDKKILFEHLAFQS